MSVPSGATTELGEAGLSKMRRATAQLIVTKMRTAMEAELRSRVKIDSGISWCPTLSFESYFCPEYECQGMGNDRLSFLTPNA